jgi:hypothetical protein
MSHEEIAPRLVDYVRSTLDDATRSAVDAHVAQCQDCRDSLETVTELQRLKLLDDHALLGHVQAQHLVSFAEGRLEGAAAGWVERHIAECETCSAALTILRDRTEPTGDDVRSTEADGNLDVRGGWWRFLRRTILAPAPALAYLVLLAVLIPLATRKPQETPALAPAIEVLPAPVRLFANDDFRGTGEVEPEIVEFTAPAGARFVDLELVTDLERTELQAKPELKLQLLSDDGHVLLSSSANEAVDDAGLARIHIPVEILDVDAVYRVTIRSATSSETAPFEAAFRLKRR